MAITTEMRTQVAQLYTALFGRAPDTGGMSFWAGQLAGGQSVVQVADTMFATAPARAYYPSFQYSPEIVSSFYRNVLGREADMDGLVFWTRKLSGPGATPGSVIAEMIQSVAHYTGADPAGLRSQQLFNNKVAVAQYYADAGGGTAAAAAVLSTITSDPATAVAAIAALSSAGIDAPLFSGATVNGGTLVMSYADAGFLDAAHPPAASAFAVKVGGVARAVTAVAVDADDRTVTLTLASAVTSGQAVTVAYTDPTAGNDVNAIQDGSGHDAASLRATPVTNNTPVGADTAAPVLADARVNGSILVLEYTDANLLDASHAPPTTAFTVKVDGVVRAINSVAVDASSKTVTLKLASAVSNGQAVTVSYRDPSVNNDANAIQDVYGNDAASFSSTEVTNNAPDTTAPVFKSATVSGTKLVMTYTELNTLDPANLPAASTFTVTVNGTARAVNSVLVDDDTNTVTLTLASPVAYADLVKIAYADPTSGNDAKAVQDDSGNDAASFAATTVSNNTPDTTAPVFAGAEVNGASLVMSYFDLNWLDDAHIPAASAFTVTVAGMARSVNSVAINGIWGTVTLTLASPVAHGEAVTVAYADPTAGNDANAIQDYAGNDAPSVIATVVTNKTPAIDPGPVFAGATVNGAALVMSYTDDGALNATNVPSTGAFTVLVEGVARAVDSVAVNASAKTVTLMLSSAVAGGENVTVAYADPTAGNDANAIQDANGNDAASLAATAVTNNTPDTVAPVFAGATVDGDQLVLAYTELDLLDDAHLPLAAAFAVTVEGAVRDVSAVAIDADAGTVTLTLASAVAGGEAVTVAYTDPTAGNDANAIQDASGNDAASFAATPVTHAAATAGIAQAPVGLVGLHGAEFLDF